MLHYLLLNDKLGKLKIGFYTFVKLILIVFVVMVKKVNASSSETVNNSVNYGFNKLLNTFLFTGNADLGFSTNYGDVFFKQSYNGMGLTGVNGSFREDESFSFLYKKSIFEDLSIKVGQNWLLSTDSRSIGLNNLSRLNALVGMVYNDKKHYLFELGFGGEKQEQVGYHSLGKLLKVNVIAQDIETQDYNINLKANTSRLALADKRNYNTLNVEANALTLSEDSDSKFEFFANYNNLERDLFSGLLLASSKSFFENRVEDKIRTGVNFFFPMSVNINNSLFITYTKQMVNKQFNDYSQENKFSGVVRKMNENLADILYTFNLDFQGFRQEVLLNWQYRSEINLTNKKFDLTQTDLSILRNQESQRDNIGNQMRLRGDSFYNISENDTINFSFSNSLLRYDTPSNENNDDRDELNQNLVLSYGKRYNSKWGLNLKFSYFNNHLVFIKSARSSLNNTNRILQLSPSLNFKNDFISFKPEFDITANYTMYDFEYKTSGISSFSFRQISYKDSINIKVKTGFELDINVFYRYFERGIFFSNTFSELPQNSNLEQFVRLMFMFGDRQRQQKKLHTISSSYKKQSGIFSEGESLLNSNQEDFSYLSESSQKNRITQDLDQSVQDAGEDKSIVYGLGLRYYKLAQNNLTQQNVNINLSDFSQTSLAPEISFTFYYNKLSSIVLSGWYEFRFINLEIQQIPNLLLTTNIYF